MTGKDATAGVRHWLSAAAAMAALVLLAVESAALVGGFRAGRAAAFLNAEQPLEALHAAGRALRLDPWDHSAAYGRCVALKRLGRWEALAEAAAGARVWSPDGYSLLLLEAEGAFAANRSRQAAEALWLAFMQSSRPKFSAAQFWRMAMLAGGEAWGRNDARVRAAAAIATRLAPDDPHLPAADRLAIAEEARGLLSAGAK